MRVDTGFQLKSFDGGAAISDLVKEFFTKKVLSSSILYGVVLENIGVRNGKRYSLHSCAKLSVKVFLPELKFESGWGICLKFFRFPRRVSGKTTIKKSIFSMASELWTETRATVALFLLCSRTTTLKVVNKACIWTTRQVIWRRTRFPLDVLVAITWLGLWPTIGPKPSCIISPQRSLSTRTED